MGTFRVRSHGPTQTTGWYKKFESGAKVSRSNFHFSRYMEDIVGNRQGNNAMLSIETKADGSFTGDNNQSGLAHRSCSNYSSNRRTPEHIFMPRDSNASLAAKAAARSNPSQAHVNVPLFIFELKDLPLLVKRRGRTILQNAAEANLNWQFGIRPLLSDLSKMVDFSSAFDKRMEQINDLNDGLLKRRVQLSQDTAEDTESFTMESVIFNATSDAEIVTERDIWATVYWKPSTSFSNLGRGSSKQRKYIRRALLGLTRASVPLTIWDALPWSWLADWFANAGQMIQASNNSVGYLCEPVVLCIKTKTTRKDKLSGVPDWAGGTQTWNGYKLTKERHLAVPGFSASVPLLSKGQLSILGSLSVLRTGRNTY